MSFPWSLSSPTGSGKDSSSTSFSSGIFSIPCQPECGRDFKDEQQYLAVPETGIDSGEQNLKPYIDDSFLKYINVDTSLLQKWFAKISWRSKLNFVRRLLEIMKGNSIAYDLVTFIGPPTKDYIYSQSQFTNSSYDIQPFDHDRSTNPKENDLHSDQFVKWFENLSQIVQLCVILGLLQIGGSRLSYRVYSDMVQFAEHQEKQIKEDKIAKYKEVLGKHQVKSAKELQKKMGSQKSIDASSRRSSRKGKGGITSGRSTSFSKKDPIELVKLKLKKKHAEFDKILVRLERMDGAVDDGYKTNKKMSQAVDYVQFLPLWTNRRAIKMLAARTKHLSHVNHYWGTMMERIHKEEKARKRINAVISKYQKKMKINRAIVPKAHVGKEKLKSQPSKNFEEDEKMNSNLPRKSIAPSMRDPTRYFSPESAAIKIFVRPFKDVLVNESFCEDRKIDVNGKWCASSLKRDVEFCNINTGSYWTHRLTECHDVRITCLAFHPDGLHLFTGSFDGTVKMHDIWRNETKRSYNGHSGCILNVVCNEKLIASCSSDNTILIHDIVIGTLIFKEIEPGTPSHLCFSLNNKFIYSASCEGHVQCYIVPPYLTETSCIYKIPVSAHKKEITSLSAQGKVILTTGVDGTAKLWSRHSLTPIRRGTFTHGPRINSGVIAFGKLIAACEDGILKIWEILTGLVHRVIVANVNRRPILSLALSIDRFNAKLILNSEANVKLLLFPIKRPANKTRRNLLGSNKVKKISALEKRGMTNYLRNAVHTELHDPEIQK